MIDVVLNKEIVRSDVRDDLCCLRRSLEEEAGNVPGVDRLDQQFDAVLGQRLRGKAEIVHEHTTKLREVGAGGRRADQAIHLAAVERPGVFDGARDAIAKFFNPVGKDRDAPFARHPIACGQIMQHLCQPVLLQTFAQHRPVIIVGKEIFHAVETGGLGGGETIEEREFSEQHREIGSKFGHGSISLWCCAGRFRQPMSRA